MITFFLVCALLIGAPALSQVVETPSRYNYVSFDVGGTYSWLTGYSDFFWPFVYPYDSRPEPPPQYLNFSDQGSGFGLKAGMSTDLVIAGSFAMRLGLFFRSNSTGITETHLSEPSPRLPANATPTVSRTYRSTLQFVGSDILARIPLVVGDLYGLGGITIAYMVSDKFDGEEQITDGPSQVSYLDLPQGTMNGNRSFSVTDQETNNYYNKPQFGAKFGLGYFIPVSEDIVLTPEVIYVVPFGKLTSADVDPFYTSNSAATPKLSFIEFQVGIKFVIGEDKHVYEPAPLEETRIIVPRTEPDPVTAAGSVTTKPVPLAELRGRVRDALTNSPEQANLLVTDIDRDSSFNAMTSITGDFRIPVWHEGRYSVTTLTREHIFNSMLYTVSPSGTVEPTSHDYRLIREEGTQPLLLFYETDKYELQEESTAELERLVRFMKETPSALVEISGHTDSVGNDEYNQKLSERRANSAVEYLAKRGITSSRLTSIGFGKTKPVATNDTEKGRSENRRVEMTVRKK
jgi:outer membrane protein OmpA-like peptidoglycan-associated protein